MKRLIFCFTILLVFTLQSALSVSYYASAEISTGGAIEAVRGDEIARSAFHVALDVEAIGIAIGKNTIALPVSVSYFSESPVYNYKRALSHFDFGAGLSYRYRFTDLFALKGIIEVVYRYYGTLRASSAALMPGLALEFYPLSFMAVTVPVNVYINANEVDVTASVGLLFKIGGDV